MCIVGRRLRLSRHCRRVHGRRLAGIRIGLLKRAFVMGEGDYLLFRRGIPVFSRY